MQIHHFSFPCDSSSPKLSQFVVTAVMTLANIYLQLIIIFLACLGIMLHTLLATLHEMKLLFHRSTHKINCKYYEFARKAT